MSEFRVTLSNFSHSQVKNVTLQCHNDIITLIDGDIKWDDGIARAPYKSHQLK